MQHTHTHGRAPQPSGMPTVYLAPMGEASTFCPKNTWVGGTPIRVQSNIVKHLLKTVSACLFNFLRCPSRGASLEGHFFLPLFLASEQLFHLTLVNIVVDVLLESRTCSSEILEYSFERDASPHEHQQQTGDHPAGTCQHP